MTNEEIQEIVAKADDEYDRLKDRVHEQYDEIERLKEDYMILQNASDEVEEEKDKEIERLNNIINKGIELTENLLITEDRGYYQIIFKEQLKVLRGEDKE